MMKNTILTNALRQLDKLILLKDFPGLIRVWVNQLRVYMHQA